MNALIGFVALIASLVGWAIAEFKYKAFTFTRSEKDIEEEKELEEQKRAEGFKGDEHPRHHAQKLNQWL